MPDKEPLSDKRISHTICPDCVDYYSDQWNGLSLEEYLDNFQAPIMIMNRDCRIVAANKMAAELTGKPRKEITGLLGGEAMECSYARLPGGCGKTVHCETCTIRNTVNRTFEDESQQLRVPVKIKRDDQEIFLKISTTKIVDLIRIIVEE